MKGHNLKFKSAYLLRNLLSSHFMVTKALLLPMLLLMLLVVSCERDTTDGNQVDQENNNDNDTQDDDYPADSIFFSCKINNELIELKTPNAQNFWDGKSERRLLKLTEGVLDSATISYTYSCGDSNYTINFGVAGSFLVDTTIFGGPDVFDALFRQRTYSMRFLRDYWNPAENTTKFCGFFIEIWDHKKSLHYTSFVDHGRSYSLDEYDDFKSKSSCQIEFGKINDKYLRKYMKASFKGKLYNDELKDEAIELTDGFLYYHF